MHKMYHEITKCMSDKYNIIKCATCITFILYIFSNERQKSLEYSLGVSQKLHKNCSFSHKYW